MLQLEEVYGEVFRVLKPGGMFCSYEWVATKDFDPNDEEHVRIIDEINFGNGLPVRASASHAGVPAGLAVTKSSYRSLCSLEWWWRADTKLGCVDAGDEDLQGGRAGREACGLRACGEHRHRSSFARDGTLVPPCSVWDVTAQEVLSVEMFCWLLLDGSWKALMKGQWEDSLI